MHYNQMVCGRKEEYNIRRDAKFHVILFSEAQFKTLQ